MIEVYLNFNGLAAEAAHHYAAAFQGEVSYLATFGEAPDKPADWPPEAEKLVMHANVKTYAGEIMLSDDMPGSKLSFGEGMWACVSHEDLDKLRFTFDALSQGGEVVSPMQETFFSPLYGMVRDKFGVGWMIMSSEGMLP